VRRAVAADPQAVCQGWGGERLMPVIKRYRESGNSGFCSPE
jgi:hypothetical protein